MVIQSEPTQSLLNQLILAALDLETQFFLCLGKSSQSLTRSLMNHLSETGHRCNIKEAGGGHQIQGQII